MHHQHYRQVSAQLAVALFVAVRPPGHPDRTGPQVVGHNLPVLAVHKLVAVHNLAAVAGHKQPVGRLRSLSDSAEVRHTHPDPRVFHMNLVVVPVQRTDSLEAVERYNRRVSCSWLD